MNNLPFMLRPSGKDYLWGGNRLNDEFDKNIPLTPLAETWECSTHPDGPSYVTTGSYTDEKLADVIKRHPEYLGTHPQNNGDIPLLIKFIDANQDLSVQVHPTDEYAYANENKQLGKTEMWYVLDASKNSGLIYGLNQNVEKEILEKSLSDRTFERFLRRVKIEKDDVFFIEAGMIHAICEGALIVEIQENSNLTYRLYDYEREDKNGNKRELHVQKALEVANLKQSNEPKQPMRVLKYSPGVAKELLCRCKHFEVYRMLVNTERRQRVVYKADDLSFRILLCIKGCGNITFGNECITFYKGDCIFVPANSIEMNIHGQAHFLDVRG